MAGSVKTNTGGGGANTGGDKGGLIGSALNATGGQSGHSIVVTTTVELIGVAVLTAIAGMNDDVGKILVVVMWGIVLGWLFFNTATLTGWINKA